MKILIVTNYLPQKIGGIERHTHGLATELQTKLGHDVTVVSASWPFEIANSTRFAGTQSYKVCFVPSFTISRRLPVPNLFSYNYWKCLNELPSDFDLVFFQSHVFINNWILAFYFRKVKRRVWMNHGCNYAPMSHSLTSFFSLIYERLGMFILRVFCNEFFAQSSFSAQWISTKVDRSFRVLSNAVDPMSFSNQQVSPTRYLGKSILFVGRLVPGKGLLESIKVVAEANEILKAKGETELFHLTVVGSGSLDPLQISKKYGLDIEWKGELAHPNVLDEMLKADVLIQVYSHPEGLTTVTLEGLALGMLVVSTPLSGHKDLKECEGVFQGKAEDLPQILVKSSQSKMNRQSQIEVGYNFVMNNFSWTKIAHQLTSDNLN